jgi:hypothetical protein
VGLRGGKALHLPSRGGVDLVWGGEGKGGADPERDSYGRAKTNASQCGRLE